MAPVHAEALFEGLRDKRLYDFIDDGPPASIESLRERFEKLSTQRSPDGLETWLNWALRTLKDRRYIGYVQATLRNNSAEIAYVIFVDAWGNGYGREAVAAMVNELGAHYAVTAFRAHVDARNRRSVGLLEALGFRMHVEAPCFRGNAPSRTNEREYVL